MPFAEKRNVIYHGNTHFSILLLSLPSELRSFFFAVVAMFFSGLVSLVTLGLAGLSSVAAYPDPGACSGDCWAHDPCLIKRSDGTYFRFNTGSEIGIWTADAITGPWVYQGAALPSGSKIDLAGNTDLWVSCNWFHQIDMYRVFIRVVLC